MREPRRGADDDALRRRLARELGVPLERLEGFPPDLVLLIGARLRELQVGETYVIHGDTPHKAVGGPDGASVVDVFSPPRADWERLERLQPSAGDWP